MIGALFLLLYCSLNETFAAAMPFLNLALVGSVLHAVASRRGRIFKICSVLAVALFTSGWRLDTLRPIPSWVHPLGMRGYQNVVLGMSDPFGGDSFLHYQSQSPGWSHQVRVAFDRILTSDAAYGTFAGGCWVSILLAGFAPFWLTRRANASMRMADKYRGPLDNQSRRVDALMFFLSGEELGANYQLERLEKFEKRYPFDPTAASKDHFWNTVRDAPYLIKCKIQSSMSRWHSRRSLPRR